MGIYQIESCLKKCIHTNTSTSQNFTADAFFFQKYKHRALHFIVQRRGSGKRGIQWHKEQ
jgi:hypothetical protein